MLATTAREYPKLIAPKTDQALLIWPEPLPIVVATLTTYRTVEEVFDHLPDVEVVTRPVR